MQKDEFRKTVEDFIEETEMSETNFGIGALKQPNFVFQLKDGRECREATQEKCLLFMENYRKNNEREKNGKQN
jgi:homoserine dehydrogenase